VLPGHTMLPEGGVCWCLNRQLRWLVYGCWCRGWNRGSKLETTLVWWLVRLSCCFLGCTWDMKEYISMSAHWTSKYVSEHAKYQVWACCGLIGRTKYYFMWWVWPVGKKCR
jgi:hypothetical protein